MNNINSIRLGLKPGEAHGPSRQDYSLVAGLLLAAVLGTTATTRTGCDSGAACAGGVILLVLIGALRATSVHLVLGSLQVHCCLTRLLRFQRSLLGDTTCHRIELGTANQVLEVSTWREKNVHRLDVLGCELLDALRPFAADGDSESTQLAQLDLVAVEQLLHQALAHIGDYAFHRTA